MKRGLLTAMILFSYGAAALAQPVADLDQGTQVFRVILHRLGLEPILSIDDALENPQSSLIVLHGATDAIQDRLNNGRLFTFIKQGGCVLIASDRFNAHFVGDELGVHTAGPILNYFGSIEQHIYRSELRNCPLLMPPNRTGRNDILKGLKRVATNNPSWLRGIQTPNDDQIRREIIAETPSYCQAFSKQVEEQLKYQHRLPIGQCGMIGSGRYIVIADHSIFINSMLLQTDNDNIAFTTNVVNWLNNTGKRQRVLFVDEGQIRTEFDINLEYLDPPLPHPDMVIPLMDKFIVALEQDDFFNRTLLQLVPQHRILRGMLLGLTILVAAVVLYRITAGKWRREAQAERLPDHVESLAEPVAHSPLSRQPTPTELGAAAQELAYSTLHDLVGDDLGQAPVVHASNPLARRTWTRRVNRYWQVAAKRTARTISAANLKSLVRRLDELRRAVERGDVHLSRFEESA